MAVDTAEERGGAKAMSEQEVQKEAGTPTRPIAPNREPEGVNWAIVYHRLEETKAGNPNCKCARCVAYLGIIHEKYWTPEVEAEIESRYRAERARREARR